MAQIKDLRTALWLDPECADNGGCQSLRFKAAPPKLHEEQILKILDSVRMQFARRAPTESVAILFARAIEKAHGIDK